MLPGMGSHFIFLPIPSKPCQGGRLVRFIGENVVQLQITINSHLKLGPKLEAPRQPWQLQNTPTLKHHMAVLPPSLTQRIASLHQGTFLGNFWKPQGSHCSYQIPRLHHLAVLPPSLTQRIASLQQGTFLANFWKPQGSHGSYQTPPL